MPVAKAIGWSKNLSENTHSWRDLVRNPVEDELHLLPSPNGLGRRRSFLYITILSSQRPHVLVNVRAFVSNRLLDHDPFKRKQPLAFQLLEVAEADTKQVGHFLLIQEP